ncbi:hypothetical protein PVL29_003575 [Vitis rotundifolia]|uniref:Wall-associated receptor kinase galacturonan-binding domain-containing protein n=1 Tax=Vitis rotundifolia TaxID=103349 RepID=A0AA39AEK3_VITRO|nr:hypothetical protein PVL29_003575 [Vitis rotundifolia]
MLFLRILYFAAYESQFNNSRDENCQWLLQISLLLWLSIGAAAATQGMPGCQERCGDVDIPYPFGIGFACYFDEWFEVTCNKSTDLPKPFLNIINMEVLSISLDRGTIQVNNPVLFDCSGEPSNVTGAPNFTVRWEGGPFSFSENYTRFTAVGCGVLAYIEQSDAIAGGCMSSCKPNETAEKKGSCYGLGCCQTEVPPALQSFTAYLDSFHSHYHGRLPCKSAFMVDQEWFISNGQDPDKVTGMDYVPAVLDWRIYNAKCNTSTSTRDTSTITVNCGNNTVCSSTNQDSSVTCDCLHGYEGNPYLPQGRQGTQSTCYC